ncbi:MAG TPA: hypothetical protein EYP76_00905 [Thiomicrorhabdus sp.]|nr:hypothetical protein [Thiomicrorhabdus sp.]
MNKHLLILVFFYFNSASLLAQSKISVSQGKYADYYHIQYTLTNVNFTIPKNNDPSYNGQFEILLNKSKFPIPSKNCKSNLILRMPATLKNFENSRNSIIEKTFLFNEIQSIKKGKKKSMDVIIELNPYVSVVSKNPLALELKNCNVFFRTNKNQYINKL